MNTALKIITSLAIPLFGLLTLSCQNTTSSPTPNLALLPAAKPLPAWTKAASQKSKSKSGQQVRLLTQIIEISYPEGATDIPKELYQRKLSPLELQAYLRAIAQKKGADIMTAPSVVTLSGQAVKVEIIREIFFPETDTPGALKTADVGIASYSLPTTLSRRDLIQLKALSSVTNFRGFHQDRKGDLTPVIETRRLEANTSINDGHALILGGLITEETQQIEDQTPLLGDLPFIGNAFSSKRTETIKKELIAVTIVEIIDPSGRNRSRN